MTSGPQELGKALDRLMRELGIGPKIREYDAVLRWPEAVGAHIAKVASAEKIQNGILTVRVTSPTWRYELTLRKEELAAKINAVVGSTIVTDIHFV